MPSGRQKSRINFNTLKLQDCVDCFGKSAQTIRGWVRDGAPQNEDKTYRSAALFKWFLDNRVHKKDDNIQLLKKKIHKEIEYKDAQILKMMDRMIERNLHDQIMVSRAGSLRQFLEKTLVINAVKFVDLSIEEARSRLLNLSKQMMEAYTGGEGNIENED